MQLIIVGKRDEIVAIIAGCSVIPLNKLITKLCPVVITNLARTAERITRINFKLVPCYL